MSAREPDVALTLYRDLPLIEREWRAFEQCADCTVFQTFAWQSAWQRHVGANTGARPAVVIGRDAAGAVLFLLPLATDRRHHLRRLIWLGSDNNDYNAPLLAPAFRQAIGTDGFLALWPRILARIRCETDLRYDFIHLVRMPESVGGQPNPLRQLQVARHASSAHLAHLAPEWDAFYAQRRSATTRQRDRTKRRRLEAVGPVKLRIPSGSDEIGRSFQTLIDQKSRSFARMGVPNIFNRPGNSDFYKSLALDPSNRGLVHLSRLDVGTEAAAVNLGLMFRGRYYHILASHDDGDLSRHGPGAAHLHELIRHAIDSRCTVFDFTVGDESYKSDWSDTRLPLFELVAAAGWRGALVCWCLRSSTRAKRQIKESPRLWSMLRTVRAMVRQLRPRPAPRPIG